MPGHAGGQQAGARHHVEAQRAVMRDGRSWPAPGPGRRSPRRWPLAHVVEDDRHIAARPVEMGLDHLQREGGGDRGVEGVAALFQVAMPTAVAIQWVEATTPKVPSISGPASWRRWKAETLSEAGQAEGRLSPGRRIRPRSRQPGAYRPPKAPDRCAASIFSMARARSPTPERSSPTS